jgi:hypothetical protein
MISTFGTLVIWLAACVGIFSNPATANDSPNKSIPAPATPLAAPLTSTSFAFWYESWGKDTWDRLQPASVVIGVPSEAVADIHSHAGKALNYVTFYQARFGSFFLKDKNDLDNVCFHTPNGCLPSAFGGKDNYVLCSNSSAVQKRALSYVTKTINEQKFDGLFIDNTYLSPATKLVCDANHPHIHPEENGGAAYIDLLKTVFDSVKLTNPAALVIANPGDPSAFAERSHGMTLWDVSDYVLWESYLYTSIVGPDHVKMDAIARSYELSRTAGSRIIALSYPMNAAEAFYSYALASAFGFKYAANLGVNQQVKPVNGGHFGLFAPSLPKLIGGPIDASPMDTSPILIRHYSNGIVIANTGNADFHTVAEITGVLHTRSRRKDVRRGERLTVPKGQAAILMHP